MQNVVFWMVKRGVVVVFCVAVDAGFLSCEKCDMFLRFIFEVVADTGEMRGGSLHCTTDGETVCRFGRDDEVQGGDEVQGDEVLGGDGSGR
ncbi:hypothetical protein HDF12_000284 [Edaphobacter lichenicola]|uniref:Uncharacterized protein n=1 Tax=Tunturiibacter lichenicola TaxID=2051959 RepID=A0A7Y9T319_9BACT|nr:hypothetical protein [Edaphobacter lichenicola]